VNVRAFGEAIDKDLPLRFTPKGQEIKSLQTKRFRSALAAAIDALLSGDSEIRDGLQPSVATWLLVLEKDLAVIRMEQSGEEVSVSMELRSLTEWTPKATLIRNDNGSAETTTATAFLSLDRIPGFPERLAESPDVPRESLLAFWQALLAARAAAS
jgi:hypothetical protein